MSFTVKMDGLKAIIAKLDSAELKDQVEGIARHKGIAALIGQAVADNFAKQGPGWMPLKKATIAASLSKKKRKEFRAGKIKAEDARVILQRTRLLYKTATIPGFSGSGKSASGSNTYRVEGTNIFWGTSLIYAKTHNKGDPARGIPQREFLVIRAEWMARINEFAVARYLELFRDTILRGG